MTQKVVTLPTDGSEPIGRALRFDRIRRGLRQYQVAHRAGLTESQLSLIENLRRDPTPEQVERIRQALAEAV